MGDVALVLVLILLGYGISRLAESILAKRLARTRIKPDSVHVIKRILFYSIFILLAMTILGLLGIPITAFAFATGAIAIGLGFGAQNIINNFISGWILMAERPIRVDDFIEMDNWMGFVKRVGTRSTLIHRTDGVHVLVPNSKLLENTVVNWTLMDGVIRNSIRVGVAYGSDVEATIDGLRSAINSNENVLKDPEPQYVFEDFADSALIFEILFWADMNKERPLRLIRSDLRMAITKELDQRDITIAFPQRDIHLHAGKPLSVTLQSNESNE